MLMCASEIFREPWERRHPAGVFVIETRRQDGGAPRIVKARKISDAHDAELNRGLTFCRSSLTCGSMLSDTAKPPGLLGTRLLIFLLASSSFACLIGTLYGFWAMKTFACFVYLPAALALALIAASRPTALPALWIVQGALAGVMAAFVYDIYRLPFVLNGAPLFKVFPRFGELLLGATEPRWLVQGLGWS